MTAVDTQLLADLDIRDLVSQHSGDAHFPEHINGACRTLYCGFDPTADSLHIGSLVPLLTLRRFQLAGHKPIALVGGATGLIGDPSFKTAERKLNSDDVVAHWTDKLKSQVSRFIDFSAGATSAEVVNNLDWVKPVHVIDFLRDVGKHFSVNNMINKESVKQRIDREGAGISFTEFSYMLLQSYDFTELNKRYGCTLQIGGSDQWGNITGGIDLTRRLNSEQVFGMTLPLVTKADGTKFGKTESGTLWLDSAKTSPYAFYQYWLNAADVDVYTFLRYFTFLPIEQIVAVEMQDKNAAGRPQAQGLLAEEVTRIVHGDEGLNAAQRISHALFSGSADQLTEADYEQLRLDGLPTSVLTRASLSEKPLTQWLVDSGLASSGKQVKDALVRQAVTINGTQQSVDSNLDASSCFALEHSQYGRFYLTKLGKKKYHLFEIR